jgi:phenylacetate-CoA ligase
MKHVVGRTSDFLVDARGETVNPWRLVVFLQRFEPLGRYRIVQTAIGRVEFIAQLSREFRPEEITAILRMLHDALGRDTEVTIRRVDLLPPDPRGKHRFVTSLVADADRRGAWS